MFNRIKNGYKRLLEEQKESNNPWQSEASLNDLITESGNIICMSAKSVLAFTALRKSTNEDDDSEGWTDGYAGWGHYSGGFKSDEYHYEYNVDDE